MMNICVPGDPAGAANLRSTPMIVRIGPDAYDPRTPRVRFASYRNEDTGETTALFLHSHEDIDSEIDWRVRADITAGCERTGEHETTRARFYKALAASR